MKAALLVVVITLCVARYVCASGAPMIDITTADNGVRYRLQNINARTEKDAKTLEEVEAWLRDVFKDKEQGKIVLIDVDDRTTFKTVSDVLRRAKAAGVEQFGVTTAESINGERTSHSVVGQTDRISSRTRPGRK